MRSHGRSKRSRHHNKDHDGDVFMNVQGEDHRPDTYSRSHGTVDSYRTASTSSRSNYVPDRERPSHPHHEEDWHRASYDHDRYPYTDPYPRDRLDDYDDGRSGGVGWGTIDPPAYPPPSRHDWPPHYEHGSAPTYPEPSPWDAPADYGGRSGYVSHWPERDNRDLPVEDWGGSAVRTDHVQDRRQDWRQDGRREKNSSQGFQGDSGWGHRRRERDWPRDSSSQPEYLENGHSLEERSWEPAESWKSSVRNGQQQPPTQQSHQQQQQQRQNGQRSNGKSKRNREQKQQKREWRPTNDGDPNNWTRRDTSSKSSQGQTTSKRKHAGSSSGSRSRSHSPAESYTSHRSYRGRSRSPSVSPASKRQRRDDSSPVTFRSQSPTDGGHRIGRRRSMSRASSFDSDRDGSRSPDGQHRRHRLPLPSQASIVEARLGKEPQLKDSKHKEPLATNGALPVKKEESTSKNGKNRWHKRDKKNREKAEAKKELARREAQAAAAALPSTAEVISQPISISMPPPAIPSMLPRSRVFDQTPVDVVKSTEVVAAKPGRGLSTKGAGFKPIGKPNSSIKKFFPGDDDDMDSPTTESAPAPSQPPLPTAHPSFVPARQSTVQNARAPPLHERRSWSRPEDSPVTKPNQYSGGWAPGLMEPPRPPPQQGNIHAAEIRKQPSRVPEVWPPPPDRLNNSLGASLNGAPPALNSTFSHPTQPSVYPPPPQSQPTKPVEEHTSPAPSAMSIDPDSSPREPAEASQGPSKAASTAKDLYSIVNQVGEGTFGKVYKARNGLNGGFVALKRIRMESERDGFPVTAMREIKLLQSLRHDNVVRLYEMMVSKGSVYMVFEYMDHDLTGILSQSQFPFTDAHLKSLCYQMLAGLAYLHQKGVIHRDIKGSNILVNNRGELKLADFGLARFYQKRRQADYTNRVITLWYRPPELLFGATVYGPEVDMWSAGCIMLELFTKKPIFQGNDEIHQVEVVFKLLGSPTPERWPDAINLPWYELVKPQQNIPNRFRDAFQKWLSPAGLDLAEKLLEYDPKERITATQAMETAYFTTEAPPASRPLALASLEGEWHELETKRERAKRKERKNPTSC